MSRIVDLSKKLFIDVRHDRGRRTRAALRRLVRPSDAPATASRASAPGQWNHFYVVDFGESAATVWTELTQTLRTSGIPSILGGETSASSRRVNVLENDVLTVLRTVHAICGEGTVLVRKRGAFRRPLTAEFLSACDTDVSSVDIMIPEHDVGEPAPILRPGDQQLGAAVIEIVAWHRGAGPYGRPFVESTVPNAVAQRLRSKSFLRLASAGHVFGEDLPAADQPDFPVDVVYTWVDGDDPEWQAEKAAVQRRRGEDENPARVAHEERFRNRDELKYSLRSLEEFAPWVRKVFIVTAGQRPDWLDPSNPRVQFVDHTDIYADQDWLPTFNSSGIETQLHHISGLARRFLYFNDDFFLGQACEAADFFFGNGALKYFPSQQMAYEADIDKESDEYIQADRNAINLLAREFPRVNRQIMSHVPYPSDRTMLQEMEDLYPEAFDRCGASKFRSSKDIRPIAFMQYHYGYHKRMAFPATISHRYLALWKQTIVEQMNNVSMTRKYKTFCINDVALQPERTEEINEAVVSFLESYFPKASSFEL